MGFLDGLLNGLANDYRGQDNSAGTLLGNFAAGFLEGAVNANQASNGGIIYTEACGNMKKNAFYQSAGNPDLAAQVLSQWSNGQQLTTLFNTVDSGADADNQRIMGETANYIQNNYNVSNGDTFLHILQRGGNDGWMVWSQFLKKEGLTHFIYYFSF